MCSLALTSLRRRLVHPILVPMEKPTLIAPAPFRRLLCRSNAAKCSWHLGKLNGSFTDTYHHRLVQVFPACLRINRRPKRKSTELQSTTRSKYSNWPTDTSRTRCQAPNSFHQSLVLRDTFFDDNPRTVRLYYDMTWLPTSLVSCRKKTNILLLPTLCLFETLWFRVCNFIGKLLLD